MKSTIEQQLLGHALEALAKETGTRVGAISGQNLTKGDGLHGRGFKQFHCVPEEGLCELPCIHRGTKALLILKL